MSNGAKVKTHIEIDMAAALKAIRRAWRHRIAVNLIGGPGIGKTTLVYDEHYELNVEARKICAEMNCEFGPGIRYRPDVQQAIQHCYVSLCEQNMATGLLPDIIGYFLPSDIKVILQDGSTFELKAGRYTFPYWQLDKFTGQPCIIYKKGILLMDEYGQAPVENKRGVAGLIEEFRIGEHFLPVGFNIAICSNRATDRSGVTKDLDHIINRRCDIFIAANIKVWATWAVRKGVGAWTIQFANKFQQHFFHNSVPDEQGPYGTPRSLVKAGRMLEEALELGESLEDPSLIANLAGTIGAAAASDFLNFVKMRDQLPTVPEIKADPDNAKIPTSPDAVMVTVYELARLADPKNLPQFVQYMKRFKKSYAATFVQSALARDVSLIHERALNDWTAENGDLVAMTA